MRHPDFAMLSPSGRTVIVYQEDDSFDVIDVSAGYAVQNVKRDAQPVHFGFGQLIGKLLGYSHRAARP